MPTVETGLFVLVLVIASAFTFGAFKTLGNAKGLLHIVAMGLFLVLGVYGTSGHEVSTSVSEQTALINSTDGSLVTFTTNSTSVFIAGGEQSAYLGYVFIGLAMLNLVLFVKDVWGNGK